MAQAGEAGFVHDVEGLFVSSRGEIWENIERQLEEAPCEGYY
jgi:hypothetical protein